MRRTTVKTWQRVFSLEEFARRLGIPEEDAPHLLMAYVEVFRVEASFVRSVSEGETEQWRQRWRKRTVCKKLGLEPSWAGCLTRVHIDWQRTVELRFVS